jgi:esterase/lipase superfamily enzyme
MHLIVLVILFFICSLNAHAADSAPRLVRIPLFFVTDRNQLPATKKCAIDFGSQRKYIGDCKHDPFLGTAYSVVENVEKKQITPDLAALGWAPAEPTDKLADSEAKLISKESFEANEKAFYDQIHQAALKEPDKTFFVFAHGYKYAFKRALFSAARLAYYAERPLVLYSWPSVGKLSAYDSDENNVEWSQDHFNDMIVQLEQLCADDPNVKIRLMAHSMGSRLLIRATPLLHEKHCFTEFALICPDVDDGLVKHYARRYLSVKGTTKIRLYMSQKDKALAFSQLMHGGYARLGEAADAIGSLVSTATGQGNASSDTKTESPEDSAYRALLEKTKARMQTIDFTNIDLGWMGHSIPDKLICSMSYTNSPPPGLAFKPEESGARGKLSQRFSRMTKIHDAEPVAGGTVLRVVRVSPPPTAQPIAASATVQPKQ